jgi:hypothetical protein
MVAEKLTVSDNAASASQKASAVQTASVSPGAALIDSCLTGRTSGTAFAIKLTTVPAVAGVESLTTWTRSSSGISAA